VVDSGQLIGLGTYQLGPDTYRVCRDAFDLGYRHVDTASLYGNEDAVGKAVRESGTSRDKITVTSKIWVDDIRADRIGDAVARSVLLIGKVDTMLLHAPVGDAVELGRSWDALCDACRLHGIPVAGVSNYRREHLAALSSTPSVNQIEVSPFLPRRELIKHCRRRGIRVVAHTPLAKAKRLDHPIIVDVAREIDLSSGAATPAQVMLAWSIAHGLFPLTRSRSRDRLAENLQAAAITLRLDQIERLDTLADGFATHPQHLDGPGPDRTSQSVR